jgi:hypothetical protein
VKLAITGLNSQSAIYAAKWPRLSADERLFIRPNARALPAVDQGVRKARHGACKVRHDCLQESGLAIKDNHVFVSVVRISWQPSSAGCRRRWGRIALRAKRRHGLIPQSAGLPVAHRSNEATRRRSQQDRKSCSLLRVLFTDDHDSDEPAPPVRDVATICNIGRSQPPSHVIDRTGTPLQWTLSDPASRWTAVLKWLVAMISIRIISTSRSLALGSQTAKPCECRHGAP